MQVLFHGVPADAKNACNGSDRQSLFPGSMYGMPAGKLARGRLTMLVYLEGSPFRACMAAQCCILSCSRLSLPPVL